MDGGTTGVAGTASAAQARVAVEVVALVAARVHAFVGRPDDGPAPDPVDPRRERIVLRADLGVVGDRYFAHPAHREASVTVLAQEAVDAVAAELGCGPVDPVVLRRTVVLRGFDVDTLARPRDGRGATFSLDTGDGPVRFQAHRPAHPCRWMDVVIGPGAFRALRGRGGVRCAPVDDGVLRVGPGWLRVERPAG